MLLQRYAAITATFTLTKLHFTVLYLYSPFSVILPKCRLPQPFDVREKMLMFCDDILVSFCLIQDLNS